MSDFLSFVLVEPDAVFSIANLLSFYGFSLILASVVLIIHTFANGRNYR